MNKQVCPLTDTVLNVLYLVVHGLIMVFKNFFTLVFDTGNGQIIKPVFNKFEVSLWKIKLPLWGNSSSKRNTMSKQLTSSWGEFRESSSFPDNKSCLNYLIENEVFSQFTKSKHSDKLANFQEKATALGIRGPQK